MARPAPRRLLSAAVLGAVLGPVLGGGLATAAAAADPDFRLGLPVDCEMGRVCVVQNYVDQDPGPAARDHTCGPLAYDGHGGTDIRVPSLVEMREGVAVLAAADGKVKATRDGMADVSIRDIDQAEIEGRKAGNGVVVVHPGGWETQYSHLLKGSVTVRPGDPVTRGQVLGLIGLSGHTEFPHVEFSVRREGKTLDPFTGQAPGSGCGRPGRSLWSEAAAAQLAYRPGGLLLAGFAARKPALEGVLKGEFRRDSLTAAAPALVFWAVSWGLRGGDEEVLVITRPDGSELLRAETEVPRDKAQWFRFGGKKRPPEGWAPGLYRADYRVLRRDPEGPREVVKVTREIELR